MSNHLAIATISAVLQARIDALLDAHGLTTFSVSAQPPAVDADHGVYLHVFRVVPNPGVQPMDLPTRRGDGSLARKPVLAINLHFLLTFVGRPGNTDFDAERLAGLVMTELHTRPWIHPDEVRAFLGSLGGGSPLLASNLGDNPQPVRLSLLALDLEDLSRLWGMMGQSGHRLAVAYEAAVVLLEEEVATRVTLPVLTPAISVTPGLGPVVDAAGSTDIISVYPAGDPGVETLVVAGRDLRARTGLTTFLLVGENRYEPVNPTNAEVSVPLDGANTTRAGAQRLRVVHGELVGGAVRAHATSGSIVVVVQPTVTGTPTATAGAPTLIDVRVTPAPEEGQLVTLVLNKNDGSGASHTSTVWEPNGLDTRFSCEDLAPGTWLVRVSVDGAVSPLVTSGGAFVGPTVTV